MSEPFRITRVFVVETIEDLVREYGGDHVYGDGGSIPGECFYVHTPEGGGTAEPVPGCLVGHLLHVAGVDLHRLARADRDELKAGRLVMQLEGEGVLDPESGVISILDLVQDLQDSGTPWGECLEVARMVSAEFSRLENR